MNQAGRFSLTVVVPAYNEAALLAGTVGTLREVLATLNLAAEIIIVNDGSRDRTGAIADGLATGDPTLTVCHQENQGLGGALRTGFARARGEYVISWPADMPVLRTDLAPFAEKLGAADVLVGVRSQRAGYSALMQFNSWLYPKLVAMLFGLHLRDVNWIHAYRTAEVRRVALTQRGIPMLVEILVRLRDRGASFLEVRSEMKPRTAGVASASRFKIMWRTLRGLFQFWWLWRRERSAAAKVCIAPAAHRAHDHSAVNEKIINLICAALRDLGEEINLPALAHPTPDTRLFGAKSVLDSMALVSLIADLEGRLAVEFGRDLILADERAMSQMHSPFRTVDSLARHVEQLLAEQSKP